VCALESADIKSISVYIMQRALNLITLSLEISLLYVRSCTKLSNPISEIQLRPLEYILHFTLVESTMDRLYVTSRVELCEKRIYTNIVI
jgi:hypothetical protein